MAANKVPYGAFIAIEPSTGRILAMTSYSAIDAEWGRKAFYETYPMASLFKIVTASAALENGKINPQSVIHFRGNAVSENPKYWEPGPKGRSNSMDVTCAMGKSVKPGIRQNRLGYRWQKRCDAVCTEIRLQPGFVPETLSDRAAPATLPTVQR
jgi:cell division protein FtsI/penicillin-binding protein 2